MSCTMGTIIDGYKPFWLPASFFCANKLSLCKKKLAWSVFYRSSILPELDKIYRLSLFILYSLFILLRTYLLCVKFGLVWLPLFDAMQVDFILESLYIQ